jgi:hypothetical protein
LPWLHLVTLLTVELKATAFKLEHASVTSLRWPQAWTRSV